MRIVCVCNECVEIKENKKQQYLDQDFYMFQETKSSFQS